MSFPYNEQETVCVYDRLTDTWSIYSNVQKHVTKLIKQYQNDNGVDLKILSTRGDGKPIEVRIDKLPDIVTFRSTNKKKREISEEQRQRLKEQLMKNRNLSKNMA